MILVLGVDGGRVREPDARLPDVLATVDRRHVFRLILFRVGKKGFNYQISSCLRKKNLIKKQTFVHTITYFSRQLNIVKRGKNGLLMIWCLFLWCYLYCVYHCFDKKNVLIKRLKIYSLLAFKYFSYRSRFFVWCDCKLRTKQQILKPCIEKIYM